MVHSDQQKSQVTMCCVVPHCRVALFVVIDQSETANGETPSSSASADIVAKPKENPTDDQPQDDSAPPSHSKLAAYIGRPHCHHSCDLKFDDNKWYILIASRKFQYIVLSICRMPPA